MKALLLVDIQNDFMPGGALAVKEGDQIVDKANSLIIGGGYDLIVATQDWHPPEHGSFADNHEGRSVFDIIDLNGLEQVLWPVHCVQGSWGAKLHPMLLEAAITKIFYKGTDPKVDSYSGFWDNDKRNDTGLEEYLKKNDVTDIDIIGLATDYCVKFTALDAISAGFKTRLIVSGCRAVNMNKGDDHKALSEMLDAGIDLIAD